MITRKELESLGWVYSGKHHFYKKMDTYILNMGVVEDFKDAEDTHGALYIDEKSLIIASVYAEKSFSVESGAYDFYGKLITDQPVSELKTIMQQIEII